jgi:hypothetical protein
MIRFKQFVKLSPEEREALKKKPSTTSKKSVAKTAKRSPAARKPLSH